MKVKHKEYLDEDLYKIEFGNEKFDLYYHKKFPHLNTWSLHRYRPEKSNGFLIWYDPIFLTKKFDSLKQIKKFIRDPKAEEIRNQMNNLNFTNQPKGEEDATIR